MIVQQLHTLLEQWEGGRGGEGGRRARWPVKRDFVYIGEETNCKCAIYNTL